MGEGPTTLARVSDLRAYIAHAESFKRPIPPGCSGYGFHAWQLPEHLHYYLPDPQTARMRKL